MARGGTPGPGGFARRALYAAAGGIILALVLFAVTNVTLLERWGSKLGGVFDGSRPISLPLAFVVVFVAGVLTSLTPCVYPVVPLAVTYLGARGATSRLKAFSLASAYVAGMVACYTALGAVAGLTGTTFGRATQKWWVFAIVATVILLFGLSMLGVFSVRLPASLSRVAGKGVGKGYAGAVLMGATSGLVTAPCTAPVLGALLSIVSSQSVLMGSLLLAVFGLGMGMLFLVVGTYSGMLASLPRSGKWMNIVKIGLGTAILLVAVYFYYQAYQKMPSLTHRSATPSASRARHDRPEARHDPLALPARWSAQPGSMIVSASPLLPDGPAGGGGSAAPAAPAFSLDDFKGRNHTLAAYRGKTLHLVFFAVWCPPCVDQIKRIEIADARLRGRGYRVLVVGIKDREDNEALRTFADRRQLGFPIAWDRDGGLATAFGVDGIPAHVIVSPTGAIIYEGRDIPQGFERDGAGLVAP